MKERPIPLTAFEVRAILEGRKTQTRRVVKPQPERDLAPIEVAELCAGYRLGKIRCPFGVPGDRLWCKETWRYYDWTEDGEPHIQYFADSKTSLRKPPEDWKDKVSDIWTELSEASNFREHGAARDGSWRPSIHMPRWASRIILEVESVRVERVQEISTADALAEGMTPTWGGESSPGVKCPNEYDQFAELWNRINGVGSWESNPWCWCIQFKVLEVRR